MKSSNDLSPSLDWDLITTVASCSQISCFTDQTEMITVSCQHLLNTIRHLVWQISTAMAT